MRTLAIDTSSRVCSVALLEDGAIVAERHEGLGRGHAEWLIPWIAALPGGGRAGKIIVGCGPGSFTGVRIGIAAARGLGLGWNVPVRGISSLQLMAADRDEQELTVAIDAGHGEIFVQDLAGSPLRPSGDVRSLTPRDAAVGCRHDVVIGSGAEALIAERGWGRAVEVSPRASNVRFLKEFGLPLPIYGRDADAKPMAIQTR